MVRSDVPEEHRVVDEVKISVCNTRSAIPIFFFSGFWDITLFRLNEMLTRNTFCYFV